MATSFENKKALRFVITLSTGKFGSSNNDRITLQGFRASGEWVVACIDHHLESEKPGGAWFSTVRLNNIGLAITGR